MTGRAARVLSGILLLLVGFADRLRAQDGGPLPPLHQRINALLEVELGPVVGPLCDDAEFIRRVSLDLVGVIPTAAETRAFLENPAADKRTALVDRLLADPRYTIQLATWLSTQWMERRAAKHVTDAEWVNFLRTELRAGRSYPQLVESILASDGAVLEQRGPARFLLDRDADAHLLTRDVGRMFLGVDLQCAQCHDHPLIEHYSQSDYYSIFAGLNRTYLFNDPKLQKQVLGEKAEGEADFKSVFTQESGRARIHLPEVGEFAEVLLPLGKEYVQPPSDTTRGQPVNSRRSWLARALGAQQNTMFYRNGANRIWAMLLGRGLVHPVDLNHGDNPPVHPAVLDALTAEFQRLGGQFQPLIREICLTHAYQRSIDCPDQIVTSASAESLRAELDALAIQRLDQHSLVQQSRDQLASAHTAELAARETWRPLDDQYFAARQAAVALVKPAQDAATALTAVEAQIGPLASRLAAFDAALAGATAARDLQPEDAEVVAAAALFQGRAQAIRDQLTPLLAQRDQLRTTQDAAIAALQTAEAEVASKFATAEAQRGPWIAARDAWQSARRQLTQATGQVKQLDRRIRERQLQAKALEARQADLAATATQQATQDAFASAQQTIN